MFVADTLSRTPLRLSDIPDVAHSVALHGSLTRAEVGGSYCFGIIVGMTVKVPG